MKIRLAQHSDVEMVFEWINDPIVRRASFNSTPIPFEHHKKWFFDKIQEQTTVYHIAEINDELIGQVRYDLKETEYIISILIAPDFRGKGFSTTMLKTSLEEFFKQHKNNILAFIKKTNTPSLKLFNTCSFKKIEDVILSNEDSIKLCLSYEDWKS